MKIPLAEYGVKEILFVVAFCVVVTVPLIYFKCYYFIAIPILLLSFVFYFFRDPERKVPNEANIVVAPADGTIIEITEVKEESYIKEDSVKIAIFLSVFNVHINRAPLSGKVEWVSYKPGKFLVASEPDASKLNESNDIGINTGSFKTLVRQVSGILARRIVCAIKVSDTVKIGERIGMIKFGSRTELYLPKNKVVDIRVKIGDKVKGAQTIMAVTKE
jgi:phosphatidylserine decarboxylase